MTRLPWHRGRLWLVSLLALAAVGAVVLGVYTVRIQLAESTYCRRGSYAWFVTVPSVMRSMPTPGAIDEPEYYSTPGDGPKPAENEVTFSSSLPPERVRDAVGRYLLDRGYRGAPEDPSTYRRTDGSDVVHLEVAPSGGASKVTITHWP